MKNYMKSRYFIIVLLLLTFVSAAAPLAMGQDQQVSSQGLFEAAEADWKNQQWEQAVAKYRLFVQQYPMHPLAADAHFQLGYYLSYVASSEEAIAEYEQTIALAPGTHDAHEAKVGIAALKFWQQDYEGAYELFRQVIVETQDWAMIKECVFRMKEIGRLIQLQKLPREQSALVDCGPRSLEIVFKAKHITTSSQEIEKLIAVGRGGATMEQLKEASQSKGLKAWGVKVTAEQFATLPRPLIVLVRPDHFVVVTNTSKDRIQFFDPNRGDTYRTKERFQRLWQGYALVFTKDIPSRLRSQLLTKSQMEGIRGGHHLHGMNLGGADGNPASKFTNDPNSCSGPGLPSWSVNMSNYNFLVHDTDFAYSGRGPSVGLTRMYNADDPREGVFGRSWTFNYDVFLSVSPNGTVDVKREGGKVDSFSPRGDGTFDPPRWIHDQLIKSTDGTYKLILKGSKLTESFNVQGKLAQITDRNNNSVTLQYDANNRLISVTDAVGRVTQFTYNAAGKVSQVTDPINRKATFSYDANNNLISTVDMAGNVSNFTYNGTSYMTSLTTPNGTTQVHMGTTPHFTEFPGLLKDIVDPLGNVTRFDTGDYIAWVFDARGNQIFYFNDSLAQTTQIEDALGNKSFSSFSSATGDLISITDPNGTSTNMTYDSRGNVTSLTNASGNSTSLTYDADDNLTQVTDSTNHVYTYQYDAKGNLTRVTDPRSGVTTFAHDSFGQLTALTDSRGNSSSYTYDTAGNPKTITNPVAGVVTYTYDGVGRVVSKTDPKGQITTRTYDGIDRTTSSVRSGVSTTYTYSCCRLTGITDPSGTISFSYDGASRISRFTNTSNQTIQYAYDENGSLAALTYPDGKVVHYEYDAANHLKKVTDWLSNTTTYNYDALGNVISAVNSNGTVVGAQYDNQAHVVSLLNSRVNNSLISGYKYAFNTVGNRSEIGTLDGPPTLTARNVVSTYDSNNRITTATAATFSHDANGNLTAITGPNAATYSYDAFDRLVQATSSGLNAQYQYDGLGNRIRRTINGTVTKYVVDPRGSLSHILGETDSSGTFTAYYVYGLGLISKITPSGQAFFYHYDGLGNTTALTDSAASVVNRYTYDSFGSVLGTSVESLPNGFRFVGRDGVMDEGNGLLYMRARYYDTRIGRFITNTLGPFAGGTNLYAYVGNNPINSNDPLGLYGTTDCSYYATRCSETHGFYYCHLAPMACNLVHIPCTNWDQCVRQCLQDYDSRYSACTNTPYTFLGDFIPSHRFCFGQCYENSNASPFEP
jgi:RHS repeat-associated protein